MSEQFYWGEGGEYGPYHAQADGWPNAGEVMRDYRVRQGISIEEAARCYNEVLEQLHRKKKGKQNTSITASWITMMEKGNHVPTDITRRRLLADLFGIPYTLFGLASLEQVVLRPKAELQRQQRGAPTILHHASTDITRYEQENRLLWQLHDTSTAHASLHAINAAISHLEIVQSQAYGRLKGHVLMLLDSYYQLGSDITREDQRAFRQSYEYANKAVLVTKSVGNDHKIALALYTRGYTNLVWGLFGEQDQNGAFKHAQEKIIAAINDFEQALHHAPLPLKGYLWMELSRAYAQKGSPTDISIALNLIDKAEKVVGVETIQDAYIPLKSFNEGMYHLGRAVTLTATGRPEEAIEMLDELETLHTTNGIGRNQLRRRAWVDIQYAQACFGMKEYYEAIRRAVNALHVCEDIHSVINISILNNLYSQLPKQFLKGNQDAAELKALLADYRKGYQR